MPATLPNSLWSPGLSGCKLTHHMVYNAGLFFVTAKEILGTRGTAPVLPWIRQGTLRSNSSSFSRHSIILRSILRSTLSAFLTKVSVTSGCRNLSCSLCLVSPQHAPPTNQTKTLQVDLVLVTEAVLSTCLIQQAGPLDVTLAVFIKFVRIQCIFSFSFCKLTC